MRSLSVKVFDDNNMVLSYNYPEGYKTTYEIIKSIMDNGGEQLDIFCRKINNQNKSHRTIWIL